MAHLIEKSALVAEIRKRLLPVIRDKHYGEWEEGQDSERIAILGIIDTLEVKEVDLEKEAELIANSIMIPVQANLYHTNIYNFEKRCFKHSDLKEAAKKGFELGLKAQKGE